MKFILAVLLVAAAAAPARAESTYWENRWRSSDYDAPEYRRLDDERVVKRRKSERPYARPGRYAERAARPYEVVPNPLRVERHDGRAHPTMNNDYWLQQSIYDFQDGKPADLKSYRY